MSRGKGAQRMPMTQSKESGKISLGVEGGGGHLNQMLKAK